MHRFSTCRAAANVTEAQPDVSLMASGGAVVVLQQATEPFSAFDATSI